MGRANILLSLALFVTAAAAQLLRSQAGPGSRESGDAPAPVYILLVSTIDDPWNLDASEERLQRTLPLVERYRRQYPKATVSWLVRFSGTMAEALVERNRANHLADAVRKASTDGLMEIGYDGTDEPTFVTRPRPNFRGAKTPEQRWLARRQAAEWFLNEYKDPLTGAPDPDRPGGLRRVRMAFGEPHFIMGVTLEMGSDSETVHELRRQPLVAALPGLTENTAYPARLLHGYRGASAMHGSLMSPDAAYAPELYYQDNVLRLSTSSGAPVRAVAAIEGPEALEKLLAALDRSRPHVIQVKLGSPSMYMRPDFEGGRYENPLRYVYDNPKGARLPEDGWQPRTETEAAYTREQATIGWLCERFLPANPGSRFTSVAELIGRTRPSLDRDVPRSALDTAVAGLLREWAAIGNNPPNYARSSYEDFSLADMFQMLISALSVRARTGALPEVVTLRHVYGPIELTEEWGPGGVQVPANTVDRIASELAPKLESQAWSPLPANVVPAFVVVGDQRINAAQFLRLMGEAYAVPPDAKQLTVQRSYMFSGIGEGFPRTRERVDEGAVWTLKPARLRVAH